MDCRDRDHSVFVLFALFALGYPTHSKDKEAEMSTTREEDIETARQFYADLLAFEARMEEAGGANA